MKNENRKKFTIKEFIETVPSEEEYFDIGIGTYVMREILRYYNRVYGKKIGGSMFKSDDVIMWARAGTVPRMYGGNKITARVVSGIKVYTIEGLIREDVNSSHLAMQERHKALEEANVLTKQHAKKPLRTELYYRLAHIKPPPDVLPKEWKKLCGSSHYRTRRYRFGTKAPRKQMLKEIKNGTSHF